jgi:hypothetical protein
MQQLYNPFFFYTALNSSRTRFFVLQFLDILPNEKIRKGPVIIYGGGWHRREMFFLAKILLTQPLKSKKFDYPTSSIN